MDVPLADKWCYCPSHSPHCCETGSWELFSPFSQCLVGDALLPLNAFAPPEGSGVEARVESGRQGVVQWPGSRADDRSIEDTELGLPGLQTDYMTEAARALRWSASGLRSPVVWTAEFQLLSGSVLQWKCLVECHIR